MTMKKATGLVFLGLLAAAPSLAGTVTGAVKMANPGEAERTVVFIETVPEASFASSPRTVRLSQRGAIFNPGVLPVVRGTHVDMTNDDWVAHNVFAKSEAKPFDLGLYAQDKQKIVVFDKLGVVQLFCSIHPRMNAVILVLQNPFFTKPAREGRFSLEKVPEGTYEVKVFRTSAPTETARIKVPAVGNVEASF
jgi:plastocyanin